MVNLLHSSYSNNDVFEMNTVEHPLNFTPFTLYLSFFLSHYSASLCSWPCLCLPLHVQAYHRMYLQSLYEISPLTDFQYVFFSYFLKGCCNATVLMKVWWPQFGLDGLPTVGWLLGHLRSTGPIFDSWCVSATDDPHSTWEWPNQLYCPFKL